MLRGIVKQDFERSPHHFCVSLTLHAIDPAAKDLELRVLWTKSVNHSVHVDFRGLALMQLGAGQLQQPVGETLQAFSVLGDIG